MQVSEDVGRRVESSVGLVSNGKEFDANVVLLVQDLGLRVRKVDYKDVFSLSQYNPNLYYGSFLCIIPIYYNVLH